MLHLKFICLTLRCLELSYNLGAYHMCCTVEADEPGKIVGHRLVQEPCPRTLFSDRPCSGTTITSLEPTSTCRIAGVCFSADLRLPIQDLFGCLHLQRGQRGMCIHSDIDIILG